MDDVKYFPYGEKELAYLRKKDKKLSAVINRVGHIERAVDDDLFSAVVHHIVGQQISTKAQATVWARVQNALGTVDAEHVLGYGEANLQSLGISFRKAEYITDFAKKVHTGEFDLISIGEKPDEAVILELSALKGIGVWTAEMLLLFCLQRPNVFSYGDLAILRGMRMVYRHKEINRARFERYRKRFSPYCSIASLYFWAVSGGALPELTDPPRRNRRNKRTFSARIEKDSLPKRLFRLERLSFLYRFYHNEIREPDAVTLYLLFFNGRIVALLEEAFCSQRCVRCDGFWSDKLSPSGL